MIFCLIAYGMACGLFPAQAQVLSFSPPRQLAVLPWSDGVHPGVPVKGVEWMAVDRQGRFWLELDRGFDLYAVNGRRLETITPLDKLIDFYGFASMEVLTDGRIVLLERMESRFEQQEQDDFELRSKPGVRLVVLKADGKMEKIKEEVDARLPHSNYYLENGVVYSVHEDGTYEPLDSIGPPSQDRGFRNFAAIAANPAHWRDHLRALPVFSSESRIRHDVKGNPHVEKDAKLFLLGEPFVEGLAPLAERNGKIFYEVVCNPGGVFINAVFVEDPARKNYALVDLISPDKYPIRPYGQALFVDEKGNLFEGVAQRDGYRIYEWKRLP